MAFEHEIKVRVADLDAVRGRLRAAGADLRQGATFEDNWVVDDAAGTIARGGCLLRVRRWGETAQVTFKGPASFTGAVKTRQEIETAVGDPQVLLELLAALGYRPWRRYQKRRETWSVAAATVALDETPMGCFVEIEGAPEAIPGVAAALGLDPAAAIGGTYLHLWEIYRASHPEAPSDMVFA